MVFFFAHLKEISVMWHPEVLKVLFNILCSGVTTDDLGRAQVARN